MDRNIVRYSSYCIVLVLWLVGVSNAGAPTAVITDNQGEPISVKYAPVGKTVHFYGDESFDTDENGVSIEAYGWTWWRSHEPNSYSGAQTSHLSCDWSEPGTYNIYLAVRDDEGVWSNYLMCTVYVMQVTDVRLFTSAAYDDIGRDGQPGLTDCQVHFDFREGAGASAYPDIYIELDVTGGSSTVAEDLSLKVTSDSDGTGIQAQFHETGANTGVYRVVEPIHVATASNQGALNIKVIDEERLFVAGVAGPKVDRGEICTAVTNQENWGNWTGAGDNIRDFFDKDFHLPNNHYYWWGNGHMRWENPDVTPLEFGQFIKNIGNIDGDPADFLFEMTHGWYGNIGSYADYVPLTQYEGFWLKLYRIYKPGGNTPGGNPANDHDGPPAGDWETVIETDWDTDVEWVILYSCGVLGTQSDQQPANSGGPGIGNPDAENPGDPDKWTTYWDDALMRLPNQNNCHGILSSSYEIWPLNPAGRFDLHMQAFCESLEGNQNTVVEAYMDSAEEHELWAASALFHLDNIDDYVNNVTPDTTDTTMYYTWFWYASDNRDTEIWEGAPGREAEPPADAGEPLVQVRCKVPDQRPTMSLLKVQKGLVGLERIDRTGFDKVEFDNAGRVKFEKNECVE